VFDTSIQFVAVAAVSMAGLAFIGSAALVIGVILYRPAKGRRRKITIPDKELN
jgi:hypothetical protein